MGDHSAIAGSGSTAPTLTGYAWLSLLAALLTIALKSWAFFLTGSVGLLSDAAESLVNLVAAAMALGMLWFAAQPADAGHPFGHGKAEYFASGFEGLLILIAAGGIAWAAWERVQWPQPLARLDLGMAVSAAAGAVNLAVAMVLLRAGRRHGSIILEADGKHLLTDVWTTGAILLALVGVTVTGWLLLDPIIAFLAAVQITWAGVGLIARSVAGLLDAALPAGDKAAIEAIFDHYRQEGVEFHDLRTRAAGRQRFVNVHVLVPGRYSVQEGHDLLERIEADIRRVIRNATIATHLEPLEDAASFDHERIEAGAGRARDDAAGHGKPPAKESRGQGRSVVGILLLVLGSGASMGLPSPYAEGAMGLSLIGLVLVLSGFRRGGAALN